MMQCASITDLTTFASINNKKEFFLDTNVLYWYSYPRFTNVSKPHDKQRATPYFDFVDKLVSDGNPLYTSVYNITEMLHVIEKNEFALYELNHPEANWSIKDFRKIPHERNQMKRNLSTALSNVRNICTILDFNFTYNTLEQFVNNLQNHRCDTFDYAILQNCIKENKLNVISDDSDFSTMDQIHLYTANAALLTK
ncbi:PIN domain-containing protein [bacterium 1XD8-76]|nr:PIN domain-containing protein [bacterium 1XD8-76]